MKRRAREKAVDHTKSFLHIVETERNDVSSIGPVLPQLIRASRNWSFSVSPIQLRKTERIAKGYQL